VCIKTLKNNGYYLDYNTAGKKLSILATECICEFHTVLRINSDYVSEQL
jgi:hypothetical protein